MEELRELAKSAGYAIIEEITQKTKLNRKYQIGSGKVEDIAEIVQSTGVKKIIFYNTLSTTQIYNISEKCKCEVIDKFQLILEIFAIRATTNRSKMQVELAKLNYDLPKVKMITSLLKKREKPGFMGLGGYEKSYERDIKSRIRKIKQDLMRVQKDNKMLRNKRHEKGFSLVSLAGYTNAGKSTLFNALVHESVQTENNLFTTLAPTTRAFDIKGRSILLTDTVGFIEDLPHCMVDAFKSTLDEIFYSDIILLIIDASEPITLIRNKLAICHNTLWKKIGSVTIITVLNKYDLISENKIKYLLDNMGHLISNPIFISSKKKIGLNNLLEEIHKHLPKWNRKKISLPMSAHGITIVSWLCEKGIVHNIDYTNKIIVDIEAREEILCKAIALHKSKNK